MAAPAKGTSRTAQNDVALIKKKGPGALATAYLVIYNVVMTAGWLVIAVGLVRAYLSKGSYHGLYYSIERPLKFFQTGALLEVQNEDSVLLFVVAWTVTEIIRYSFYTFSLLNHLPYLIKWARYTLFIVLYPMGVTGELLTIYAALPYVQKTGLYSVTLPNKYNFSFDYYTFLILESFVVPELDGVRIVSRSFHEFLHEVPGACEEIFKIASMAPGALLLEAHKEYEASSFGKCFLSNFPPEQFVGMCLDLRVLNALLEFEPRSGEQVPLLLKMKRSQLALSKAIESGDTDLVYTVVTYLKNEMNRGDFFMTLRNQPVALGLYRQFCKHQEQNTLKDLFNQDDDHQELGNFYVRASYGEGSVEARMAALQNAVDEFNKAKNEFSAKATEEQMKLLRWQRRFQEEFDKPYLDCSLHETVHSLLLDSKHKQAEQLYKDFRIPDKRFWWLKISALAEKEDWEELEKFSKSKKSPVGYLPFVEICVKHHNKYEAKKYVTKVTLEQKVKAHLAVGDLEQAVEAAIERSESELNLVLSRCTPTTDRALLDKINRARAGALKK
ncbi:UNVERIFIED_CONTAM: hypothetical protein FKN15_041803 [Acipenser sinensis]